MRKRSSAAALQVKLDAFLHLSVVHPVRRSQKPNAAFIACGSEDASFFRAVRTLTKEWDFPA